MARGLGPLARTIVVGAVAGAGLYALGAWIDGNYFLWGPLADVTLDASAWFVGLYAGDVYLDAPARILGTGTFRVIVTKYCSGLEGLALFGLFFGSFLVLARERLRLARAIWVLPAGMLLVWVLNAARIAALIALGSYYDPKLAVDAFHTHAGWPPLIAVALGCVAATTRIESFRRVRANDEPGARAPRARRHRGPPPPAARRRRDESRRGRVPRRVRDLGAAARPGRRRGAVAPPRTLPRPAIALAPHVVLLAAFALAVWLVFDPTDPAGSSPPSWLADANAVLAALWWTSAAVSYVVVTPVVEELAFRGYAQRRLTAARFGTGPLRAALTLRRRRFRARLRPAAPELDRRCPRRRSLQPRGGAARPPR
ncbi:MAG: exosortase/archaeosortase family protein [Planctomycetota bacterium]